MTIYINTPGTYTLTADVHDSIVIGVSGVTLDGNGYTVRGNGQSLNTIGILSSAPDTIVQNVKVTGFGAGMHLGGASSEVHDSLVYGCAVRGIGVAGGGGLVEGCIVGNIDTNKYFFGAATGIVGWGTNNRFEGCNVYGIKGDYESVGYVFGNGGEMVDCLAQGHTGTGWSFGVWAGGGGAVTVTHSYIHSFDIPIGNTGPAHISDSTILAEWKAGYSAGLTSDSSLIVQPTPNNSPYIIGTTKRDTIVAGDGNNKIVGLGGADTLVGGLGNDIFVCSPYGALTLLPEFTQGQDKVSTAYWLHNNSIQNGTAATGSLGTMLFNPENHTLYHDRDGAGRIPAEQIAYIPYVFAMTQADFDWV